MKTLVWDCDERVLSHNDVDPLKPGDPVATLRLNDQGVAKCADRLEARRLVLINFSPI